MERLDEVFTALGAKVSKKPCAAMKGLVEEGGEAAESSADGTYKDILIIGAAQRVEHYEMAAYGTALALAESLGNEQAVSLLQQTLDEEQAADDTLGEISLSILAGLSQSSDSNGGEPLEPVSASRTKSRKAGSAE